MNKRALGILVLLAIVLNLGLWMFMPVRVVSANPTVSITQKPIYGAGHRNDNNRGYVGFLVHIEGLTDGTLYEIAALYRQDTSDVGSFSILNGGSFGTAYKSLGNSGATRDVWVFLRTTGFVTDGLKDIRIRVREGGATIYSYDFSGVWTLLDTATTCTSNCAGWIYEPTGTARAGRVVVVRDGTDIIGLYVAEDNGAGEDSGYVIGSPLNENGGYYRIGVPTCSDAECDYTITTYATNDYSLSTPLGQVNTMDADDDVTAGNSTELSFANPTVVRLESASARIAIAWPWLIGLLAVAVVGLRVLIRHCAWPPRGDGPSTDG